METTSKKDAVSGACSSSPAPMRSDTEPTAATVTFGTGPGGPVSAGRYRLDRCLGRGSFGEVWQAFDPVLNIVVAIKMPRADRVYPTELSDQFVEEARKQARLNHPAIVKVRHAEREATFARWIDAIAQRVPQAWLLGADANNSPVGGIRAGDYARRLAEWRGGIHEPLRVGDAAIRF